MPTITLSTNAINKFNSKFVGNVGSTYGYTYGGTSTADVLAVAASTNNLVLSSTSGNTAATQGYGNLYLLKGAVPTSINDVPNYNARAADILVTFNSKTQTSVFNPTFATTSNLNVTPVVITTEFVTASATGTATWFMFMTRLQADTGTSTPFLRLIGTVGLAGSGADLIMGDVNIVAGSQVRVSNLQLQLAGPWTY